MKNLTVFTACLFLLACGASQITAEPSRNGEIGFDCYDNNTCNDGLVCENDMCIPVAVDGDLTETEFESEKETDLESTDSELTETDVVELEDEQSENSELENENSETEVSENLSCFSGFCIHGDCINNTCECHNGYSGQYCEQCDSGYKQYNPETNILPTSFPTQTLSSENCNNIVEPCDYLVEDENKIYHAGTDIDCDGIADDNCYEYKLDNENRVVYLMDEAECNSDRINCKEFVYTRSGSLAISKVDRLCNGYPECTFYYYNTSDREIRQFHNEQCDTVPQTNCINNSYTTTGKILKYTEDSDCDGNPEIQTDYLYHSNGNLKLRTSTMDYRPTNVGVFNEYGELLYTYHTDTPDDKRSCYYYEYDERGNKTWKMQNSSCDPPMLGYNYCEWNIYDDQNRLILKKYSPRCDESFDTNTEYTRCDRTEYDDRGNITLSGRYSCDDLDVPNGNAENFEYNERNMLSKHEYFQSGEWTCDEIQYDYLDRPLKIMRGCDDIETCVRYDYVDFEDGTYHSESFEDYYCNNDRYENCLFHKHNTEGKIIYTEIDATCNGNINTCSVEFVSQCVPE